MTLFSEPIMIGVVAVVAVVLLMLAVKAFRSTSRDDAEVHELESLAIRGTNKRKSGVLASCTKAVLPVGFRNHPHQSLSTTV
ncbi:hypothetical protein QP868_10965 [Brevibacterium sp. UMB1308A]|uniref:hypothetical protein n=1 Tax=Brevibacterium sp. UMB1308A TaxID=3050608 RepID=UPI00254CEB0A|nr:hypothetical protein [Brevibacterium sp. UMB1308A]MDK8347525.1 hypothetical protein [Brevibacterium sp. UMB1308B]MDK8714414.1 hypothetical protein [Brevibacterium sp. UMB1308A]